MHFLKKAITAAVLLVGMVAAAVTAQAQTVFTVTSTTAGQPTFLRPTASYTGNTATLPATAPAVPYKADIYTPTTTGVYRVRTVSSFNNYLFIYKTPPAGPPTDPPTPPPVGFNPAAPLTNLIFACDNFPYSGVAGVGGIQLTAGQEYTFVTSGNAAANSGAYTLTISVPTVTGNTSTGSTFNRPTMSDPNYPGNFLFYTPGPSPVDDVASGTEDGTGVKYTTQTINVTTAGLYRFVVEAVTPGFDTFIALYRGSFDPNNPLTNIVTANDDLPNNYLGSTADFGLEVDTYVLVVTSYDSTSSGQYFLQTPTLLAAKNSIYTGSTVGRPTLNLQAQFVTVYPELGTAVPYRIVRATTTTAGVYYFKFFNTTVGFSSMFAINTGPVTPLSIGTNNNALFAVNNGTNFLIDTIFTYQQGYNLPANFTLYFLVPGLTNADAGNFKIEGYGPAPITFTNVAYVSGEVKIKQLVDNPPAAAVTFPVTFTYRPVGAVGSGTDIVQTFNLTSANGNYYANIPEGNYNLGIKSPRTFQRVVGPFDVTDGIETGLNALLIGADSNDDNMTDISDLLILITSYNSISGGAGSYNVAADFDYNGTNDISDLLFLIGYYNQSGQFLP